MRISRWLELAELEQITTLHHFNYERELVHRDAELALAHAEFERYLDTVADDGSSAAKILKIFVEQQPTGSLDCRFPSPPIEADDRLVFLRAVGSDDTVLDTIGLDVSLLRAIEEKIALLLQTAMVDESIEGDMQTALTALVPRLRQRATTGPVPRLVRGRTYSGPAAVDPSSTPWWFTYESSVAREEAILPDRASPLQRSGYVTGMRASLGLFHASDSLSDAEMARRAGVRFRIFFQLAVSVPDSLREEARQPAMFSDGYPDLFVTHRRARDGGRTVRLKDLTCSHHGCQCTQDGLPEGVIKRSIALSDECAAEVRGIYLAFSRDLSRFVPPSCDEIRRMRSAA